MKFYSKYYYTTQAIGTIQEIFIKIQMSRFSKAESEGELTKKKISLIVDNSNNH